MNNERRIKRKKQTAEDFTPAPLVNEILDKLNEYDKESWEEGKTFCDPACGNGNMLIEVLKRKISLGHDPVEALKTIYGTDIMQDNIRECRLRLLKLIRDNGVAINEDLVRTVFNKIVWISIKRYANGSLDYDFKFPNKASMKDILPWVKGINEDGWLNSINNDGVVVLEVNANVIEGKNDSIFDNW